MGTNHKAGALRRLLFSAAFLPVAAFAQTLQVTQDAYVVANAGGNFGSAAFLNVNGANNAQALIQFELSALGDVSAASVSRATLTFL